MDSRKVPMNQPKEPGAGDPDAEETERSDVDEPEAVSPLGLEVEAPINAAVHLDDQ